MRAIDNQLYIDYNWFCVDYFAGKYLELVEPYNNGCFRYEKINAYNSLREYFSSLRTATEAGEETQICSLCGEAGIKRPVPATPAVISSVTINISAPVNGGTPVTTAVTNNTGWNTISSAVGSVGMGTNYNANSSFTPNGNITLYANLGGFLLAVTSFVKNPLYFIENI